MFERKENVKYRILFCLEADDLETEGVCVTGKADEYRSSDRGRLKTQMLWEKSKKVNK
ncbi:MAG: hypothetical protein AB7C89_08105 [Intestinibacillus sp.]